MVGITFIISVVAVVIAIMAYKKAGGSSEDLQRQVDSIRQRTADTLGKVEKSLRGGEDKQNSEDLDG